jgi:hypothetical protein
LQNEARIFLELKTKIRVDDERITNTGAQKSVGFGGEIGWRASAFAF